MLVRITVGVLKGAHYTTSDTLETWVIVKNKMLTLSDLGTEIDHAADAFCRMKRVQYFYWRYQEGEEERINRWADKVERDDNPVRNAMETTLLLAWDLRTQGLLESAKSLLNNAQALMSKETDVWEAYELEGKEVRRALRAKRRREKGDGK